MKNCKSAEMFLVLCLTSSVVCGQSNITGFSVVFEVPNRISDQRFSEKVMEVLDHEIGFSGIKEVVSENEWVYYKDKKIEVVVNHFANKHPKTVLIFKFILQDAPSHQGTDHRLFQIKVVNLRDRTTRDLCGTYVYLAGDEEDYDDHVNEIMTMPLMHMKGIISGTYRRNSLYVVDNSELAACNNYHNAIASFFLNPRLHSYFYVLLETDPAKVNTNSIVGVSDNSGCVQFEFRRQKDILARPPWKIECNSVQSVYKQQIENYCKKISQFCRDHGYNN